jgi:16S rRNA (uracil1498-N3)-methyltransferase
MISYGEEVYSQMSERFFVDAPLRPGPLVLEGAEAHHLATVCRLRSGSVVVLFNGDGHEYRAGVRNVERKRVELDVETMETPARELAFRLEVAAPLPKGDRAQFLLEKLTELGVTSFVPLQTERSVVHPREAKLDRLRRWVIEASKQCGRNTLLDVQPLVNWSDYCRRSELPERRLLADPTGAAWQAEAVGNTALAVGPEGGFTEAEVVLARASGWRTVGLGSRILRVETAALLLAGSMGLLSSAR